MSLRLEVSLAIPSFFLDSVGGAAGWVLAGATLAPTCLPLFRSLYARSTERAMRMAGKPAKD